MTEAVWRAVARDGFTFRIRDEYPCRSPDDPNNVDFWGLYERGVWEPELHDVLTAHLSPVMTFVDVGAWIGPITLVASELAGRVVAVEPDPAALRLLAMNVAGRSNIDVVDAMISPSDGWGRIGKKAAGSWGDSMTSALFDFETRDVQAFRLASLFDHWQIERVGLVKMDIEGFEAEVLTESAEFLVAEQCPLFVSLHAPLRSDADEYMVMMRAALAQWSSLTVDGQTVTIDELPTKFASVLASP